MRESLVKKNGKLRVFINILRIAGSERKWWIWLAICCIGIAANMYVNESLVQMGVLVGLAVIGLGLELANSAIERLVDMVGFGYSKDTGFVKDAFAAAPIFAFSAFVVVWLIITIPSIIGMMA